eukprot:Lankesteria_metandrocarpae@DN3422_c0_g1_i1.p1
MVAARRPELQQFVSLLETDTTQKRSFQRLHKELRRRAQSHNPYRIPKTLRKSSLRDFAESPPKESKRVRKDRRRPANLLEKYRQRSAKTRWLETHLWHAKRMHMDKLWGYRLAIKPTEKCQRLLYRHAGRHCVIHDRSYMQVVRLAGSLLYLRHVLVAIGVSARTLFSGSSLSGKYRRLGFCFDIPVSERRGIIRRSIEACNMAVWSECGTGGTFRVAGRALQNVECGVWDAGCAAAVDGNDLRSPFEDIMFKWRRIAPLEFLWLQTSNASTAPPSRRPYAKYSSTTDNISYSADCGTAHYNPQQKYGLVLWVHPTAIRSVLEILRNTIEIVSEEVHRTNYLHSTSCDSLPPSMPVTSLDTEPTVCTAPPNSDLSRSNAYGATRGTGPYSSNVNGTIVVPLITCDLIPSMVQFELYGRKTFLRLSQALKTVMSQSTPQSSRIWKELCSHPLDSAAFPDEAVLGLTISPPTVLGPFPPPPKAIQRKRPHVADESAADYHSDWPDGVQPSPKLFDSEFHCKVAPVHRVPVRSKKRKNFKALFERLSGLMDDTKEALKSVPDFNDNVHYWEDANNSDSESNPLLIDEAPVRDRVETKKSFAAVGTTTGAGSTVKRVPKKKRHAVSTSAVDTGAGVPILIVARRGNGNFGDGCDVIMPPDCGSARLWTYLCRLGCRPLGILDRRKLHRELSTPYFPEDFIDTPAGVRTTLENASAIIKLYIRTPPSKRPNYPLHGISSPFLPDLEAIFNVNQRSTPPLAFSTDKAPNAGAGTCTAGSSISCTDIGTVQDVRSCTSSVEALLRFGLMPCGGITLLHGSEFWRLALFVNAHKFCAGDASVASSVHDNNNVCTGDTNTTGCVAGQLSRRQKKRGVASLRKASTPRYRELMPLHFTKSTLDAVGTLQDTSAVDLLNPSGMHSRRDDVMMATGSSATGTVQNGSSTVQNGSSTVQNGSSSAPCGSTGDVGGERGRVAACPKVWPCGIPVKIESFSRCAINERSHLYM